MILTFDRSVPIIGYNQLMFDDTDNQGRVQLRTTLAATELKLGYLGHSTDNYRGSLRGQGAGLLIHGAGGHANRSTRTRHCNPLGSRRRS